MIRPSSISSRPLAERVSMALLLPWRPSCSIALFLLVLPFPTCSPQQIHQVYLNCSRTTTPLSSAFNTNLDTALHNFGTDSATGLPYNESTTGSSGQDMVYAVFQCRGDLSNQTCEACVQNVSDRKFLPQKCPNSQGARIRMEGCFLRYGSQSFFQLETIPVFHECGSTNDVETLRAISDLIKYVTTEAPKQVGTYFASASTNYGLYAAAQCLRYLSQPDCAKCLSTAYSSSLCNSSSIKQLHMGSCDFRYDTYNFLEVTPPNLSSSAEPATPPTVAHSFPPPLPRSSTGLKNSIAIIVVSVVVGIIVLVGVLCAMLVWYYKASKIRGLKLVDTEVSWPRQLLPNRAQIFSLEELREATGQFHPTNKLGEGGFGVVYKGTLLNREPVAIKKLCIGNQQGKQEFLNEVNLITSVQHRNLIRLLGCCVEDPERILIYEYLPNNSLDVALSDSNRRMLNWPTRYNIVFGMARGLAYLHEESHIRIIHRDIKPSNILLDDQLNPVIADFGLARLVKDNTTHMSTGVAGTIGYLAPEYALHGALSEKVDVFSFGLVSLEVITGKKNVHHKLLSWVWEKYQHEKVLDLVDDMLDNAFYPEQVIRVVHIALLCTQENPKQRPTMSMVTGWLSGTSAIVEVPIRPTFLNYNDSTAPVQSLSTMWRQLISASSQQE